MIIEFTGIPGSGKSTILKKLSKVLKNDNYVFDIKKYLLGFNGSIIVFDIYLLLSCFKLSIKDWKLLIKIFKIILNSNNSLFHKINILRNNYKRIIIYKILNSRKDKIFFVDEGISHIPFTLFVDINKKINIEQLKDFIKIIPKVDKIIIVDAPDEVLLERVIKRGQKGHRRINFDNYKDIKIFMEQSRQVLEVLKSQIDNYVYQNIKSDIDLLTIIQVLGFKNA